MLSRKDYKAIAEIIRYETMKDSKLRKRLAENFAGYFESDNPRFDRQRFLNACGV